MPFADVGEQRLYYEVHGEGEPLLMVMGLAADHLAFVLQTPRFAESYRTIVFDNRDVGQSSYAEGPYEVADFAADTLGLADELGLERFHLLGVSMGSAIAQEVALAAPERIITLTLGVTFAGSGRYGAELSRVWADRRDRQSFEEHVDELLLLTLSEEFYENEEAFELVRQMTLANPYPQRPEGFRRQLEASRRHDARDRLGELSMPVHVIGADHDILVPVWKAEEVAELIPGARYTVLEGAGHGVTVERAEDFNVAVLDFLRSPQPAPA